MSQVSLPCPSLADRAAPIPGAKVWVGIPVWTAKDQLTFLSSDKQGEYRLVHLDTKSGRTRLGISINRRLALASDVLPNTWRVSPNGKWLLWANGTSKRWMVATTDGSRHIEWPLNKTTNSFAGSWMGDSYHWMEMTTRQDGTHIRIHSIGTPQVDKKMYLPKLSYTGWLLGVTPKGQAILGVWPKPDLEPHWSGDFLMINLGVTDATVRKYSIRLPPQAGCIGIALSPQGDRLAWALHFSNLSQDELDQGRSDPHERKSLWVSGLDGSHMTEIGCGKYNSQTQKIQEGGWGIGWTPDGKRLSFSWKGRLWIVPAQVKAKQ